MAEQWDDSTADFGSDDAFELLAELEQNRTDNIRGIRNQERLLIKAAVIVQPGNISDVAKFRVQGTTGDISVDGCRALLPMPLRVGDIYRLVFDKAVLDLPSVYAKCVSCRMVRQDGFEACFSFFEHVDLSDVFVQSEDNGNDASASA